MISIVTNITELALAGQHGAALSAALINASAHLDSKHIGLILGLFNIYSVLTAIGYLADDQVDWAPHHQRDGFDAAAWAAQGLPLKTSNLLAFLTCPSSSLISAPVIFAPEIRAQAFVGEPCPDIRDPRWQFDEEQRLPPRYFQLSTEIGEDFALVYDTLYGRVGWWDLMETTWTGPEAVQEMIWEPAADTLNGIARGFLDLQLVPVISDAPWLSEPPAGVDVGDLPSSHHPCNWRSNEINQYRAHQQILRDHGWPGPTYRRSEAMIAMTEFEDARTKLEGALSKGDYSWRTDRRAAEEYWRFLEHAAGSAAVLGPRFEDYSDPANVRMRNELR